MRVRAVNAAYRIRSESDPRLNSNCLGAWQYDSQTPPHGSRYSDLGRLAWSGGKLQRMPLSAPKQAVRS